MGVLKVDSIVPANLGSEDYFLGRAWAKYDMATGLLASANVTSFTDLGVGSPQLNLTNPLNSTSAAVTNCCGLWAQSQEWPVQAGGRVTATLTVVGYCGSDNIGLHDWREGTMGVIAS